MDHASSLVAAAAVSQHGNRPMRSTRYRAGSGRGAKPRTADAESTNHHQRTHFAWYRSKVLGIGWGSRAPGQGRDGADQPGERWQLTPAVESRRDLPLRIPASGSGWVVDSRAPELNVSMRFRWSRRGTRHCSDLRTAAGALLPRRDEKSRLVHQLRPLQLRKHPTTFSNRVAW